MKSRHKGRKAGRVVRHTLADGTVKEYHYAPHRPGAKRPRAPDSLATLIEAYQSSPRWRRLSPHTQQMYVIYLRPLMRIGHVQCGTIKRRDFNVVRDQIASARGDGAAAGFVRAASAMFAWAIDNEWTETNPAARGARDLDRGHLLAWTQEQAQVALERLPEPLRRVVVVALYTGARRGDLCAMTWGAYDGTSLRFTPQKTRKKHPEPLVIPCHPALKAELDAWRSGAVAGIGNATILTDGKGNPWKPNLLSHYLPAALVRIGLTNELNVHGLRKLAATNLAEAGCSTHQIAAITGHHSLAMVQLYTRSVDQQKLAGEAIVRLSERKYKSENTQ